MRLISLSGQGVDGPISADVASANPLLSRHYAVYAVCLINVRVCILDYVSVFVELVKAGMCA